MSSDEERYAEERLNADESDQAAMETTAPDTTATDTAAADTTAADKTATETDASETNESNQEACNAVENDPAANEATEGEVNEGDALEGENQHVVGDPLLRKGTQPPKASVRRRRVVEIVVTLLLLILGYLVLRTATPEGIGAGTERRSTGVDERPTGNSHGRHRVPSGCEEVSELVKEFGLPRKMVRIAWRESRCQPWQTNFDGEASYGVFQINTLGYLIEESRTRCGVMKPEELLDLHTNVRCAAALYQAYGYRPWLSGRYFR